MSRVPSPFRRVGRAFSGGFRRFTHAAWWVHVLATLAAVAVLPFAAMVVTSYTKIAVVLGLAIASYLILRPASLRARAERELERHLNLDVSIGHLELALFPRPRVSGNDLVFRVPERSDLPPFIEIGHFSADIGPLSALRRQVDTVHLDARRRFNPLLQFATRDRQILPRCCRHLLRGGIAKQ